jgi:peptidyl-prolyl cis-trans isomerase SurA
MALTVAPAGAVVFNRIVAVVGNEVVTSRDVEQALAARFGRDVAAMSDQAYTNAWKQEANKLVEDLLLRHRAQELEITVDEGEIDLTIERVIAQNHMEPDDMERAIAAQGMSMTDYRAKLRRDLLRTKVINSEIKPNIIMKDEELMAYAREHNLLPAPAGEQVTIAQILLNERLTKAELEAVTAEIRRRFEAGEAFADLAREYSRGPAAAAGGNLGSFTRGSLLPEIEAVVFGDLPVGTLSPVIKTRFGYHLFLVTNRLNDQPQTFADLPPHIQEDIQRAFFTDQLENELDTMLADLRRQVAVEFKQ